MIRGGTIEAMGAAPGTARIALTVLVPFGLGYYLSYLYRTVNVVLAPDLVRDLALGPADLGLLTSVYFVVFAVVQVPYGILVDRYGPRRVQAALMLFAVAGSPLFANHNFLWFTAFVGANLLQSGFTRFCPLEMILRRLRVAAA